MSAKTVGSFFALLMETPLTSYVMNVLESKRLKVCLSCGYRDNALWRHSRFDYNADYMRYEEALIIEDNDDEPIQTIAESLKNRKNHDAVLWGDYAYYRRGTGGIWLYRVAKEDYKMPREPKKH